MGADVIKVEGCVRFDWWRGWEATEEWINEGGAEKSSAFNMVNRNKRDVTLDLSTERGSDLLKRLVAISDVVVENYSSAVLTKLGLHYAVLKDVNPRDHHDLHAGVRHGRPMAGLSGVWLHRRTGLRPAAPVGQRRRSTDDGACRPRRCRRRDHGRCGADDGLAHQASNRARPVPGPLAVPGPVPGGHPGHPDPIGDGPAAGPPRQPLGPFRSEGRLPVRRGRRVDRHRSPLGDPSGRRSGTSRTFRISDRSRTACDGSRRSTARSRPSRASKSPRS